MTAEIVDLARAIRRRLPPSDRLVVIGGCLRKVKEELDVIRSLVTGGTSDEREMILHRVRQLNQERRKLEAESEEVLAERARQHYGF
jgi:pyridoxal biosynthesis lyase PdxS